ncbi:MAG: hypothetical protein JSS58_01845 [Proteobacteria bacterium]|nr:hypothetical protein [Pseudomonadota bacterium]
MTPDQIAIATLEIQKIQTWITAVAIFLGPLAGVLFTLWFQGRKERRDAKLQLFLALMAERKSLRVSPQLAQALNKIDVVFSDSPTIKNLWHKYYALLSQPPGQERDHTWLELLTAMAAELRYFRLSQTDLDKFYVPQGHVDDAEFQQKIAQNWARVLENTERFVVVPKNDET